MNPLAFISTYIVWHYTQALSGTVRLWLNALWFVQHFFSLPLLAKTLFSPWRRLNETYQGGLNFENIASLIIVNTLMRLVGAVIRLFVIAIGLIAFITAFLGGIVFFVIWLLAPIVIPMFISVGLALL